jgi:ribosomal-protein-alanine N-acetyltransferase
MYGPRLEGRNGVALVPSTLDHVKLHGAWMLQPEVGRFFGPRFGNVTDESAEERFKEWGDSDTSINWSITYQDEPVGFTGIFGIDWVRRDGESGIFIGRHDLFGRGIASDAVLLRTGYEWSELRMLRVHNCIGLANSGSRRANEKSGYKPLGLDRKSWFRSGVWYVECLGEAFPQTFPDQR